jgi:hypothetical protein
MKDYQKSITLNCTSAEIYTALTQHITDWWSDDFSGAASKKDDQYNIAFGETRKTFKIDEAVPNERLSWLCLEAYIDLDYLKKKDEWVGTKIIWTIETAGDTSFLTIIHQGLNKSIECYNACEPAWDYFMHSLQAYLLTGVGTPYRKGAATLEPKE